MDVAERRRAEQQLLAAKALTEKAPVATAELSQRAAEIVKRVHETGEAAVVVEDGQPAAVLVGAEEFALLREHKRVVMAIEEGLADAKHRRSLTAAVHEEGLEPETRPKAQAEVPPIASKQHCAAPVTRGLEPKLRRSRSAGRRRSECTQAQQACGARGET